MPHYILDSGEKNPPKESFSLREFCPVPSDQDTTGACFSYAIAYGAMTIKKARDNRITNNDDKRNIAFSPLYIHVNIMEGKDCSYGVYPIEALNFLKKQGTCKKAVFDRCPKLITERHIQDANLNKIDDWESLWYLDTTANCKVDVVRYILGSGDPSPVIVVIRHDNSFSLLEKGTKTWRPDLNNLDSLHALLVIGYDNEKKQFECLNSYGTNWGDDGFVFIDYDDFAKVAHYGFVISL